ncbi:MULTISPECIES: hypothetical protein [Methylobacteriaceae]|uniref:Uncharacterized protein n=1 Tax=Methylobacterium gregans TaxID=374424 RepID=A0AA37HVM1_9HYPH|nr:hypothetical protein [Methylobacterium gregans]MDQ0522321.1 hypothetical protein [Methylobacterium gregans]GJD81463.1 hypothetical protein NBEOAGPD_4712 [Methylobacterium gregans]GLS55064.1 hypothetical protein GCM10007886_32480 [Methylobacterium gregans]
MNRSRFVDGLVELDAKQTRARLAESLAAARAHPAYAEGPRSPALRAAVALVEADLLAAARAAVCRLDAALQEADRPAAPSLMDELGVPAYLRRMIEERS